MQKGNFLLPICSVPSLAQVHLYLQCDIPIHFVLLNIVEKKACVKIIPKKQNEYRLTYAVVFGVELTFFQQNYMILWTLATRTLHCIAQKKVIMLQKTYTQN